jgi:hypothetical protein
MLVVSFSHADPKRTLAQNGGSSLDLEIIAQREADEKDEDNRQEVLGEHCQLIALWRDDGARTVVEGGRKETS